MISRFLVLLILTVVVQSDEEVNFEEYLKYVSDYIEFTQNYQLPTNNSHMYEEKGKDTSIIDAGTYDFIIIGAGSAGTVLARRLTEVEHLNVLLLEAGGMGNKFLDIPIMAGFASNSPYNWGYKTVPQKEGCAGMVNRQCLYPIGKGLGGSHLINCLFYIRGNKADYDEWATQGNKGWSYDEILKYFKKVEHDDTNDPRHTAEYHGYEGLIHINYTSPDYLNYQEFLDASKDLGIGEIDINGASQMGIQRIPYTIKTGKRQSGGTTYIQPILTSKNLKVSLESFVTELIIDKNMVNGVIFIKNRQYHQALATKEVLLCAGAVNSPQILMLNGIGPKDQLERHNIEVKNNLPVGKHLTDHPAYVGLYIRTNNAISPSSFEAKLKAYVEGKIPFTNSFGGQHIAFINTRSPGNDPPNIEYATSNPPMSVYPQAAFNLVDESFKPYHDYNPLSDHCIFVVLMKPKSRGSITLQSNSPVDFPLIDPAFFTDYENDDIEVMYEAVQFLLNITKTSVMQSINATVITKSPKCEHLKRESDKEFWHCAIKELTISLFHPSCSTRMGTSAIDSVVDSEFRVHNMKKIRVCDAGAMPEITRGHLVAPVTMMAEKLSDILKIEYS